MYATTVFNTTYSAAVSTLLHSNHPTVLYLFGGVWASWQVLAVGSHFDFDVYSMQICAWNKRQSNMHKLSSHTCTLCVYACTIFVMLHLYTCTVYDFYLYSMCGMHACTQCRYVCTVGWVSDAVYMISGYLYHQYWWLWLALVNFVWLHSCGGVPAYHGRTGHVWNWLSNPGV